MAMIFFFKLLCMYICIYTCTNKTSNVHIILADNRNGVPIGPVVRVYKAKYIAYF